MQSSLTPDRRLLSLSNQASISQGHANGMSQPWTRTVFGVTSIFPPPSIKSQPNSLQGKNDLSFVEISGEGPGISDSAFGRNDGCSERSQT
jgi:hypothetical protein